MKCKRKESEKPITIFYRHYEQKEEPIGIIFLFHGYLGSSESLGYIANCFRFIGLEVFSHDTIGNLFSKLGHGKNSNN
jgi:alpha-beta hydrolase superfamily lysophospholipase